ncbi:conserved hypothetical protein [Altererythrobacter sp. B11]|nr:conserved hypothetical protein [Altererythrobacter sp. B11]
MREWEWIVPSVLLTVLSAAAAILFIPNYAGLLPALSILPAWMAVAGLIACLYGFAAALRRRHAQPIAALMQWLGSGAVKAGSVALIMLLAGLNLIAFMWVKPLLNYLVPFSADPLLARIDHALFLGTDPWKLLHPLAFPGAGGLYHPGWFIIMIFALLMAAAARPSPERSAVLLSYFVLWSLVGPTIHSLLPAAGPIFYERMGYGSRFAGLDGGVETTAVADYLWHIYASRSFGAGGGISAMPSMHVTISTWTMIAFATFARRGLPLAIAAWAVIFALSIALGWHYAADGIVGTAAAFACYRAILATFRRRAAPQAAQVAIA